MLYKTSLLMLLFFAAIIALSLNVSASSIDTFEANLQMSVADIIMIILSCGIIVIAAVEARIALMCAFLIYGGLFILFTFMTEEGMSGFNPYYSGVAMMVCFVIICLSLLITYKKANTPMYLA